eukprot:5803599-Amphidinium_carterae.1
MVSTVQKTVEIPQVQILEVIQDMPIIKDWHHIIMTQLNVAGCGLKVGVAMSSPRMLKCLHLRNTHTWLLLQLLTAGTKGANGQHCSKGSGDPPGAECVLDMPVVKERAIPMVQKVIGSSFPAKVDLREGKQKSRIVSKRERAEVMKYVDVPQVQ